MSPAEYLTFPAPIETLGEAHRRRYRIVAMTDPGPLPLNGLDKLRDIALGSRLQVDPTKMMRSIGLSPTAYEFGCEIVLALAVRDVDDTGLMDRVLGPLPPETLLDG